MTITHHLLNSVVWVSIERVRSILDWSHEEMSKHLHLTHREYQLLRSTRKDIPAHSILLLADELKLDPEGLSFGRIDYQAFEKHYSGDFSYLPNRYAIGAHSQRSFFLPILDWTEGNLGIHFRELLLRKLQLNSQIFNTLDGQINIIFPDDAFEFLIRMRNPKLIPLQIGYHFAKTHLNSDIGMSLKQCTSVKDAYTLFIEGFLPKLEQSFQYQLLKINPTSCLLMASENSECANALQMHPLGSPHICLYQAGVYASIPTFIGLPQSSTIETHCIHRGDSDCRFEVNFEYAHAVLKKRLKAHADHIGLTDPS